MTGEQTSATETSDTAPLKNKQVADERVIPSCLIIQTKESTLSFSA
jgi:hypothetical protein